MVVSCLSSRLPVGAPSSPPGRVCKGGKLCLATQEPAEPLVSSTCRVSASDAEKKALEARALSLSLNYSFVTPLTSMVITKPEGQEQSQVAEKPVENGGCGSRVLTQPSPQPLGQHLDQDPTPVTHRSPGAPRETSHFIDEIK